MGAEGAAEPCGREAKPVRREIVEDEVVRRRGRAAGPRESPAPSSRPAAEPGRAAEGGEPTEERQVVGPRRPQRFEGRDGLAPVRRVGDGFAEQPRGVAHPPPALVASVRRRRGRGVPGRGEFLAGEPRRFRAIAHAEAGPSEGEANPRMPRLEPVRPFERLDRRGRPLEREHGRPESGVHQGPLRRGARRVAIASRRIAGPTEPREQVAVFEQRPRIVGMEAILLLDRRERGPIVARTGEGRGQPGPQPRHVGLEPQRLAEAPRGAGVVGAGEPALAHRHEATGHAIEMFLGEEVGGIRLLEATEFAQGEDPPGPCRFAAGVEREGPIEGPQRLLVAPEPSGGGPDRKEHLGPARQQAGGAAELLDRFPDPVEPVERESEPEAELPAGRLAFEGAAQLDDRLLEPSLPQVAGPAGGVRIARPSRAGTALRIGLAAVVAVRVGKVAVHRSPLDGRSGGEARANPTRPARDRRDRPRPTTLRDRGGHRALRIPYDSSPGSLAAARFRSSMARPSKGFATVRIAGILPAAIAWVALGQAPPAAPASSESDRDFHAAVLANTANSRAVRLGAAERLLRDGGDRAFAAIEAILATGDPAELALVGEALDRANLVPPRLVPAIVASLVRAGDAEAATLGRVLAEADASTQDRIAALALDGTLPAVQRRGPILALGEFHDRAVQARLMELLSVDRKETPDILAATVLALSRSTGLGLGNEPAPWRIWWTSASARDTSEQMRGTIRALTARLEEAERNASEERRRAEQLSERLVSAMREWFMTLPVRERFERCAALLKDEVFALRLLGLREVERLLRNGERPTESVRQAARGLLADREAVLRSRGARLLRDLGIDDLDALLAERLAAEPDPVVIASYLAILEEVPNAAAFGPALRLVGDPALEEAAAAVLCRLHERKLMPPEWEASVRGPLRPVVARRAREFTAKLLAYAGEESDLADVQLLLDATDPAVRKGAAEGLRARGIRRPLLERADDPAVYPSAIAALAEGEPTLATVQALAGRPPTEAQRVEWNAAVASVLRRLVVADLVDADRLLEPIAATDARTRLAGLERVVLNARTAFPRPKADEGLRRYVELQQANGRSGDAIAFLESLKPLPGGPLFEAAFRAELLAGAYADAADRIGDPEAWIRIASELAARNLPAAGPLAEEILARFGAGLPSERRAAVEEIRRRFAPTAAPRA